MLSVVDTLARIRSGAMAPAESIAAVGRAIDKHEGRIGAFVHRAADPRAGSGPFSGIAVGIKDIIDTADMPTRMGSALYDGWQPRADAAVVAAFRRAGATIVGKTTTTAFASLDPTPTRNPRAPGHTPGGSSAGSAASVAAGMIPLAVGTQTGGSVIRPASFCGVAAIKPSFRLIPTVGAKTYAWTLDTVGLFAAGVADLTVSLAVLTGRSMTCDLPEPRVGIVRQGFAGPADGEGVAALEAAIVALERAGIRAFEVAAPSALAEAWAAQPTVQEFEGRVALGWEYDNHRDELPPKVRAQLEAGAAIGADAYDEARRLANQARREAKDLFRDVDAIITYSAPGAAPIGLTSTGDARFNRLWTLLGTPCVNVPGPTVPGLPPVGVQVVGPFGRDAVALAVAARLQGALAAGATHHRMQLSV